MEREPQRVPVVDPPSRIGGGRYAWSLVLAVGATSLAVLLGAWLGLADFLARLSAAPAGPGAGAIHVIIDWVSVCLTFCCALLALARVRAGRSRSAHVLVVFLPAIALAQALCALSGPLLAGRLGLDLGLAEAAAWGAGQLLTSIAYVVFGALVALRRSQSAQALGRFLLSVAGPACVAVAGLGLLIATGSPPSSGIEPWSLRVWDAAPLALFLVAAALSLPRLGWSSCSWVSRGLVVSLLPQVIGHAAALFGTEGAWSAPRMVADLERLIAFTSIFAGLILESVELHRLVEKVRAEASAAYDVLEERTRQLEKVDLELLARRRDQELVEQRLRMLEKAVETMSVGVTITDPAGLILYANPADARLHGWEAGELIGQPAAVYSAASGATEQPQEMMRLWAREGVNRTRHGRVFPVRLISDPVLGGEGQLIAMVTLCEDITEQKRISESIERRDRVLEAVGMAAERLLLTGNWQQSVYDVLERLGQATGVDRVYLRQLGERKSIGPVRSTWEARGRDLEDSVVLDIRPRTEVLELLGDDPLGGEALHGLVRELPPHLRSGLERRGIHSIAVVPILVRGRRWGVLSLESQDRERLWSASEIEALKTAARILGGAVQRQHAEEALINSEANYRELIETASDLIQSVSPDGELIFVNRSWREALGYKAEEVVGMPVWKVLRADQHDHCRQVMGEIFTGRQVERIETVFCAKDGKEIPVEGSLSCRFQKGRPTATLGIFRDVTERQLIDRMKQDFISTVSHELRTPLTSMLGSLGLLQSKRMAEQPEKGAELLAIAQRNGERLLRLINDLLDLQKMAAGELSLRMAAVTVAPVLEEAMDGIRGFADSLGVVLELEDGAPGARAWIDKERLVQILYNLLSNAIKFSPAGQKVSISTARRDGRVIIAVTDRGPGIPEEFRQRLFSRFAQADNANARRTGGSGLGLSIVRSFVEALDGTIQIDSGAGKGTTVTIDFPLATESDR